ncbi:hypothetical protein KM043_006341 [Ampulex compressa]|nr:hypothetical protein KM043_006341 [Ampulex compressa]
MRVSNELFIHFKVFRATERSKTSNRLTIEELDSTGQGSRLSKWIIPAQGANAKLTNVHRSRSWRRILPVAVVAPLVSLWRFLREFLGESGIGCALSSVFMPARPDPPVTGPFALERLGGLHGEFVHLMAEQTSIYSAAKCKQS